MKVGGDGTLATPRLVRPLPETVEIVQLKVLPQTLEEGMADFSLGRLGAVLDLGVQLRLYPNAFVRDPLPPGVPADGPTTPTTKCLRAARVC